VTPDALAAILIAPDTSIFDAMRAIDRGEIGMALVVDAQRLLLGFVSDGDIRRAMLAGEDVRSPVSRAMTRDAVVLYEEELEKDLRVGTALRALHERGGEYVPVLDAAGIVRDLAHVSDLERHRAGALFRHPSLSANGNSGKRRVFVVGGAGYLGSVLVRELLARGHWVRVYDSFLFDQESLATIEDNSKLEIVRGDLRHLDETTRALSGTDACILLAAIVGDPASKAYPQQTIQTNFLAARMLAEACKYQQINRFLYASTCSVYGTGQGVLDEKSPLFPVSLYARTKIISEQGILAMTDQNFAPCILRMATLYGQSPRMRYDLVLNTLTMHAVTQKRIRIFGGSQWRPLLHVRDAARAFAACLEASIEQVRGAVYNVGSNAQNYRISTLGEMVCRLIPGVEMAVETDARDARDYHVGFDKIGREIGFSTQERAEPSVQEMAQALMTGEITDPMNRRYSNHALVP
jgi:nucleoside-diphosphate-sugar epimerase/CBS domain-containing protein